MDGLRQIAVVTQGSAEEDPEPESAAAPPPTEGAGRAWPSRPRP